jgi:hypothetical protein
MNDHTTAIVPIETWAYQSPDLRRQNVSLDIGLLAEALIYYDRVLVVPASEPTAGHVLEGPPLDPRGEPGESRPLFVDLVEWFQIRNQLSLFLDLLRDDVINVYHYAFRAMPILKDGSYVIVNLQEEDEARGPSFMRRIAQHRSLEAVIPKARRREHLYRALEGRVRELRASEFGRAIENARADFVSPEAATRVVQAMVEQIRH